MSDDYVPRRGDWCAVHRFNGSWQLWRVLRVKKDDTWFAPISHVAPHDGMPLARAKRENEVGAGLNVSVYKLSEQSDCFSKLAGRYFATSAELRLACEKILKGDK